MSTLLAHEWRGGGTRGPRVWWLAILAAAAFVFLFANGHWPWFLLGGLVWAEVWVVLMALGRSMGAVWREWRDGTGHLWLRLRPPAAVRLAAKGLAVLARSAVWFVGVAAGGAVAMAVALRDVRLPGLAPGLLGTAPTPSSVLGLAARWSRWLRRSRPSGWGSASPSRTGAGTAGTGGAAGRA